MPLRTILFLLLLVLSGCKFGMQSVSSATIEIRNSVESASQQELSKQQIHRIESWFSTHASGWTPSYVSYASNNEIRATHANGDVTVIIVMTNMIVVYNREGQYTHSFSEAEINSFKQLATKP